MNKKDEALSQFESVLSQLKKGEEEIAATAVASRRKGNTNVFGALFKLVFKVWGGRILLISLLLIAMTAGVTMLVSGSTFKKDSTIYVEEIRELATLATAEAHITYPITENENKLFGKDIPFKLPGTQQVKFIIVPATVLAGVDLKALTEDDVKIDEDKKTLELVLPRATFIQEPILHMEGIESYSNEGLISGRIKWDEGFELAAKAQENIKEKATEFGLLHTAEENAEKALKNFYSNIGYTVNITFK